MNNVRRRSSTTPPLRVLGTCSPADLRFLRRHATEVSVAPGVVIHSPQDRAHWVYVLLAGTAIAWDRGRTRILGAGEVHGAGPVLAGEDRCGFLVADSEVQLLVFGCVEFDAALRQSAAFAHGVARHLALEGSGGARACGGSQRTGR